MSEEEQVQEEVQEAVSEPVEEAHEESKQEKTVPFAAYEAERKKRQEAEQQNKAFQEYLMKNQPKQEAEPEPHPDEWVSRREMISERQKVVEQVYIDSNPDKVQEITRYLDPILEQKPWLRQAIQSSGNRLATAYEVVQDYKNVILGKKEKAEEAKRMVENAKKPGSPLSMAKTATGSKSEYLLSLRGTPDFKKYRQEMLKGKK